MQRPNVSKWFQVGALSLTFAILALPNVARGQRSDFDPYKPYFKSVPGAAYPAELSNPYGTPRYFGGNASRFNYRRTPIDFLDAYDPFSLPSARPSVLAGSRRGPVDPYTSTVRAKISETQSRRDAAYFDAKAETDPKKRAALMGEYRRLDKQLRAELTPGSAAARREADAAADAVRQQAVDRAESLRLRNATTKAGNTQAKPKAAASARPAATTTRPATARPTSATPARPSSSSPAPKPAAAATRPRTNAATPTRSTTTPVNPPASAVKP